MANICPIKVGKFEGFSWIRCEGRGSFLNSSVVKEFGEYRVTDGEKLIVIDLEQCLGMDSTFMGTLAGLANKLTERGGQLHVASSNKKNTASLEDLGLDFFMEINPTDPIWKELTGKVRSLLEVKQVGIAAGTKLHSRHVLEAHEILSDVSEENVEKFSGVVGLLREELGEKAEESK